MNQCPVCRVNAQTELTPYNAWRISCPRCGRFHIAEDAADQAEDMGKNERLRAIVSSQIRKLPADIQVTRTVLDRLSKSKDIAFTEKAKRLLIYLASKTVFAGQKVSLSIPCDDMIAESWAMNFDEARFIAGYLESEERINIHTYPNVINVTILNKGWKFLESIQSSQGDSTQGFVAMWFDESMRHVYNEAISGAISEAGYSPHRVDMREHINRIDDEIMADIRSSKFVVADATGHRGGVYYEAGFAMGLGIPVFWTCRDGDQLHFDVRQYNCIFWSEDNLQEFKRALSRRILAVLGRGKSFASFV